MGGSYLGWVLDGLVAGLLVATIIYCIILARKLDALKTDQGGLRQIIIELNGATERAHQAIQGLRMAVRETGENLATRIEQGETLTVAIDQNINRAEEMLNKIAVVTRRGGPRLRADDDRLLEFEELRKTRMGFGPKTGRPLDVPPVCDSAVEPDDDDRTSAGDEDQAETEDQSQTDDTDKSAASDPSQSEAAA